MMKSLGLLLSVAALLLAGIATINADEAPPPRRPLPKAYLGQLGINYSPYRAGGPAKGEIPSDREVEEDLRLIAAQGFTLIRIFNSDEAHAKIVRIAAAKFPGLRFHLGIALQGIAPENQSSCRQDQNEADIAGGIALANRYPSILAVSVGNETSFYRGFMPMSCLKSYLTRVKKAVRQPVTADDNFAFYAGFTNEADRPDPLLPWLDFVSMHSYPLVNHSYWDFRKPTAGQVMDGAVDKVIETYFQVRGYLASRGEVTLPVVIGETGWKMSRTDDSNPIEPCCATPANAKWYFDGLKHWMARRDAPAGLFYFQATDESWKGIDDGWGLWSQDRKARFGSCGLARDGYAPPGSVCRTGVYQDAGHF